MSQQVAWCETLKLVPACWRGEFCRFIEDGESTDDFMAFLDQNQDCRRACEMMLEADEEISQIVKAAVQSLAVEQASVTR